MSLSRFESSVDSCVATEQCVVPLLKKIEVTEIFYMPSLSDKTHVTRDATQETITINFS